MARGLGAAGLHRLGHRDAGARHRRQLQPSFVCVNGLLLKPLPGLEHSEIVAVFNEDAVNPDSYRSSSLLELQQIAGDNDVFSKLFAFTF